MIKPRSISPFADCYDLNFCFAKLPLSVHIFQASPHGLPGFKGVGYSALSLFTPVWPVTTPAFLSKKYIMGKPDIM